MTQKIKPIFVIINDVDNTNVKNAFKPVDIDSYVIFKHITFNLIFHKHSNIFI